MIPKIIHYVWLGGNPFPELVQKCINSWHEHMPEAEGWIYKEWNEQTIADYCVAHNRPDPIACNDYCKEAYEAKKYAFVSDYVRLWALEREGGIYMDVDFEVYKSFEPLLNNVAFIGREGSKRQPPMMGVIASEPHGIWVTKMMHAYDNRHFICEDGTYDLTTNVTFFANLDVHKPEWVQIYSVDYFCPVLTTGEDLRSSNTYCEHKGLHSWAENGSWKAKVLKWLGPQWKIRIIKLKRKIFE